MDSVWPGDGVQAFNKDLRLYMVHLIRLYLPGVIYDDFRDVVQNQLEYLLDFFCDVTSFLVEPRRHLESWLVSWLCFFGDYLIILGPSIWARCRERLVTIDFRRNGSKNPPLQSQLAIPKFLSRSYRLIEKLLLLNTRSGWLFKCRADLAIQTFVCILHVKKTSLTPSHPKLSRPLSEMSSAWSCLQECAHEHSSFSGNSIYSKRSSIASFDSSCPCPCAWTRSAGLKTVYSVCRSGCTQKAAQWVTVHLLAALADKGSENC